MDGLLSLFMCNFHFILLLFIVFLVLVGFFHHGFGFLEELEKLVNIVLDLLLFFLNFVMISLQLFLLISISDDKLNVFLFALLKLEEIGLLDFYQVQN